MNTRRRRFLSRTPRRCADHRRVVQRLAGPLLDEHGDRHAPGALAADAPVRPRGDHRADTVAPRVGHERRRGNGGECLVTDVVRPVHRDEPLRVARKISGALDRQEHGYECTILPRASRLPAACSAAQTGSDALYTCTPANSGTQALNVPSSATVSGISSPWARPRLKSSSPWPGAICTKPVPASVVSKSPSSSGVSCSYPCPRSGCARMVPARSAPFSTGPGQCAR